MPKLNNKLENVYKQGRYTFAFAHYQVSFGNLRGIVGGVAGVSPARRGSGQATKRREAALLAGALRGATCLGARGRLPPLLPPL